MGRSVRGSVECYHSLRPFLEVPTFVWLRRSKLNNKVVLTLEARRILFVVKDSMTR